MEKEKENKKDKGIRIRSKEKIEIVTQIKQKIDKSNPG